MLGTIDRGHVGRLIDALARADGSGAVGGSQRAGSRRARLRSRVGRVGAFLQRIAIVQIVPDAALQDEEFDADSLTRLAQAMSPEDVQLYYQIALGGRRDLAMAPEPRMGFEMTLLRMLAFRPDAAAVHGNPARTTRPPMCLPPVRPAAAAPAAGASVAGPPDAIAPVPSRRIHPASG